MSWLRDRAARRQAKVGEISALLRNEPAAPLAGYAPSTRRQRLLAWLFPQPAPPQMREMEGYAPSYCETHVIAHFNWKDRLRILLGGRVHVVTRSKTDVSIEKMASASVAWPTHGF